jgi:hypothetical protein
VWSPMKPPEKGRRYHTFTGVQLGGVTEKLNGVTDGGQRKLNGVTDGAPEKGRRGHTFAHIERISSHNLPLITVYIKYIV